MTAPRQIVCCIAGIFMLSACSTTTHTPRQLLVQPNYQVKHSTNETADAYYQLARYHQGQGNLDVALAGYTYAIARDPAHMEARIAAAAIHAQQGRLDQARAMMLAVVADHPDVSQAHNNLGYIDYLRGDHASAVLEMRQALALDTGNERARNNLRLAETALSGSAARDLASSAPAAPEPVAVEVAMPVLAIAAAPAPAAPRMELVQVIPNVYELKMPKPLAATAAATPALAASATPAVTAAVAARVEVSNGDGTPGLARRVSAMLGKQGVMVARLTNQRPFGQQSTQILYRPQHAMQAESLRKLIDGPVQLTASQLTGYAGVRVVLGRDTQRAMALRDTRPEGSSVALR
jgi:Flp pilus assembly protein TadD